MSTTDLAAALNECMPLVVDDETFVHVKVHCDMTCWMTAGHVEHGGGVCIEDTKIIGILWAECVRREWTVTMERKAWVRIEAIGGPHYATGTSTLSFARAFAAAKRAEGGGA